MDYILTTINASRSWLALRASLARRSVKQVSWPYFSLFVLVTAFLSLSPVAEQTAAAITSDDLKSIVNNTEYYDPNDVQNCASTGGVTSDGVDIDRLLRTIAKRESGGNPTAQSSSSSASGKYQYIDGTWASRSSLYSEVSKYAHAKDAPEAVQDAVAYLEYSGKVTTFNGDLFKIGLSHFLPAAISDPSLLDKTPSGNSITPRQYADAFVQGYKDDIGASIQLHYSEAPNLPAVSAASSTGGTTTCDSSTDSSSLGVGKGSYTDSGEVKGYANVLANAKASDAAYGGGFVGCGVCAAIVSRVWRGANIGYGNHTDPATGTTTAGAVYLWYEKGASIGHADRKPKKGAILLYKSSQDAGHIVIYLGNNKILNDGQIANAADIENGWHLDYQGWIDPNDIGWTSQKASNIRSVLGGYSPCN